MSATRTRHPAEHRTAHVIRLVCGVLLTAGSIAMAVFIEFDPVLSPLLVPGIMVGVCGFYPARTAIAAQAVLAAGAAFVLGLGGLLLLRAGLLLFRGPREESDEHARLLLGWLGLFVLALLCMCFAAAAVIRISRAARMQRDDLSAMGRR